MSMQELLSAIGITDTSLTSNTQALVANAAEATNATSAIAAMLEQTAIDNATIKNQEAKVALEQQATRAKVGNIFGTDIQSQSNLIEGLATSAQQSYLEREAALNRINEKERATIFDDPLNFIIGKFTINQDISDYNTANAKIGAAEERIRELNQLSDSTIKTNMQFAESVTQATKDAAVRNSASNAMIEAKKAQLEGLKYNTNGIQAVLAMDEKKLAHQFNKRSAETAQKHLELALQSAELQRQKFENEKFEFSERLKAKKDVEATENSISESINKGRAASGLQPMSALKMKEAIQLIKINSPLGAEFAKYYQIGQRTEAFGFPVVATSIGNAADVLSSLPINLAPIQEPIRGLVNNSVQQFKLLQGKPGTPESKIDLKDRAAVEAAITRIGKATLEKMATEVTPSDASNVYNIPAFDELAKVSPAIQKLPLWNKVFAPLVAAGAKVQDPKLVWQQTMNAIENKTISYEDAMAGLDTMYLQGTAANYAMRKPAFFGISNWSASYNARVPTGAVSDFNRAASDLFNVSTFALRAVGTAAGFEDMYSTPPEAEEIVDMNNPQERRAAANRYFANKKLTEKKAAPYPVITDEDRARAALGRAGASTGILP